MYCCVDFLRQNYSQKNRSVHCTVSAQLTVAKKMLVKISFADLLICVIILSICIHKATTQSIYNSREERYDLEKRILKLEGEQMRRSNGMNRKFVAFSVTAGTDVGQVITGGRQTVALKNVLSNIGGGYNSTTGVFTAPTPGTYGFFFSVQVWPNNGLSVLLYVNDVVVAEALAGPVSGAFTTGSNMVALVLKKNDRVYIRSHPSHSRNHGNVAIQFSGNNFSGFLLSEGG